MQVSQATLKLHEPPAKLAYIFVEDDGVDSKTVAPIEDLFQQPEFCKSLVFKNASFAFHLQHQLKRYARFHLRASFKLMGIKNVDSKQIADHVFSRFEKYHESTKLTMEKLQIDDPVSLSVKITKTQFLATVRHALSLFQYAKPTKFTDFPIALDVHDRKYSFTILLGGTSGCGKSTLAALLASRIGFAAVISTDNIRQLMRKFITREQAPILWASTYHAGEIMDADASMPHKERIIKGYEAQNELIFSQLDVLISTYEARRESLIVEGVHLDTRLILRLAHRHPTCIPFLMYISNEAKHRERFAIRSKYMTIDPKHNKYTKYFKNIRIISDYLRSGADGKLIPQIDNTNVDRSLATIHSTIFNCLRRHIAGGEPYFNKAQDTLEMVYQEYEAIQHTFWSSKGMLKIIREKLKAGERESASASEPVLEPQPEDPDNFNSDEEDEKSSGSTPKIGLRGSHPDADKQKDNDVDTSDEESDEDSKVEFFMDCGSLGS